MPCPKLLHIMQISEFSDCIVPPGNSALYAAFVSRWRTEDVWALDGEVTHTISLASPMWHGLMSNLLLVVQSMHPYIVIRITVTVGTHNSIN